MTSSVTQQASLAAQSVNIWSWLETTHSSGVISIIPDSNVRTRPYQILTPPNSATGVKRRRSSGAMSSPGKKRKQDASTKAVPPFHLDNFPQSVSSLSSQNMHYSASQLSQPTTRSTSPTRDLLNILRTSTPPVDCQDPGEQMPEVSLNFRRYLSNGFGDRIIPECLRDELRSYDTQGFDDIPPTAFDSDYQGNTEDAQRLWQEVKRIYLEARDCERWSEDENAWAMAVTTRVLSWGCHQSGVDSLEIKSIQSQVIRPSCLPQPKHSNPVVKKADFAIVHSPRDTKIAETYCKVDDAGFDLSHMMGTRTKRMAMAAGIEVKQGGGNAQEALAQLAIWLASGYIHLRGLQIAGRAKQLVKDSIAVDSDVANSGNPDPMGVAPTLSSNSSKRLSSSRPTVTDPSASQELTNGLDPRAISTPKDLKLLSPPDCFPMVGWTAVGHDWQTYIGCNTTGDDGEHQINIFGPFPRISASTRTLYEIFKLLALMERVKQWAKERHWKWLRENVLMPLIT